MLIRRTRYVSFRIGGADDDVQAILFGALAERTTVQATSALSGADVALDSHELNALTALPAAAWVRSENAGIDPRRLSRWARQGLILTDEPAEPFRTFRHRDETFRSRGWDVHNALFHAATRWSGVRVRLVRDRELSPADAHEYASRHVSRHGDAPTHEYRRVPGKSALSLPAARAGQPLDALLRNRQTTRLFDRGAAISIGDLATVLRYVYGAFGEHRLAEGVTLLRKTSPSGGGLHPVEAYPLVMNVEGLRPGLYHYVAYTHELELLRDLNEDEARSLADKFTAGQLYFADAAVMVLMAARFERNHWKYQRHRRAMIVQVLDTGHLSQTQYLVCADLGLGAFITAAINAADVDHELGLDGVSQGTLAISGFGIPSSTASAFRPQFTPIDVAAGEASNA